MTLELSQFRYLKLFFSLFQNKIYIFCGWCLGFSEWRWWVERNDWNDCSKRGGTRSCRVYSHRSKKSCGRLHITASYNKVSYTLVLIIINCDPWSANGRSLASTLIGCGYTKVNQSRKSNILKKVVYLFKTVWMKICRWDHFDDSVEILKGEVNQQGG